MGAALLGALGCDDSGASPPAAGAPATAVLASKPADAWIRRETTDAKTALRNLDSLIAARDQQEAAGSAQLDVRGSLVSLLVLRARITGSYEDFDRAAEVSAGMVRDVPEAAAARLARAEFLSAVHRFEEALGELERAEALGAEVATARGFIHVAQGRELEALRAEAAAAAQRRPEVTTWSLLAAVEGALGDFEAADRHYQAAIDAHLDVSPFILCQILFQRGVMWAERAGQPERALPLYREVVRRLPHFVSAQVHLAELEAAGGDAQAAVARLRGVAPKTTDPEPASRLAALLKAQGRSGAERFAAQARAGYERLLEKHRAAFLDHASEFFAGPGGDAERALRLAQENLALRDGARPRQLLIAAAAAAGEGPQLCQALVGARPWAKRSPLLSSALTAHAVACPALDGAAAR